MKHRKAKYWIVLGLVVIGLGVAAGRRYMNKSDVASRDGVFRDTPHSSEADFLTANTRSGISPASVISPQQLLEKLKGEATFPGSILPDGELLRVSPKYHYKGSEVVRPGEGVPCPMFSFKGGRGELVLALSPGKPRTGRVVQELFFDQGKLLLKPRLYVSYRRGSEWAFLLEKSTEEVVRRFGIAWVGRPRGSKVMDNEGRPLAVPRASLEAAIWLPEEEVKISDDMIDAVPPVDFPSDWVAMTVAGEILESSGKQVRALWFEFDDKHRLNLVK